MLASMTKTKRAIVVEVEWDEDCAQGDEFELSTEVIAEAADTIKLEGVVAVTMTMDEYIQSTTHAAYEAIARAIETAAIGEGLCAANAIAESHGWQVGGYSYGNPGDIQFTIWKPHGVRVHREADGTIVERPV